MPHNPWASNNTTGRSQEKSPPKKTQTNKTKPHQNYHHKNKNQSFFFFPIKRTGQTVIAVFCFCMLPLGPMQRVASQKYVTEPENKAPLWWIQRRRWNPKAKLNSLVNRNRFLERIIKAASQGKLRRSPATLSWTDNSDLPVKETPAPSGFTGECYQTCKKN